MKTNLKLASSSPPKEQPQKPTHYEIFLSTIEEAGHILTPSGNGGYDTTCPAHDDSNPSMHFDEGVDRGVVATCHAGCEYHEILAALGLRREHEYRDEEGETLYTKTKTFDSWVREPAGEDSTLYGRDVMVDLKEGDEIWLSESEKDADTLVELGLLAVSTGGSTGAKHAKLIEEMKPSCIIIAEHNDEAGRKFTESVRRTVTCPIKVVLFSDKPTGYDVTDWSNDNPNLGSADLEAFVEAAPLLPNVEEEKPTPTVGRIRSAEEILSGSDPQEIIENLVSEGGITNLIGAANTGKGFVMLSLAYALGCGTKWLDDIGTVQGSTLYVGYEMEAMKSRILALEEHAGGSISNFYHFQAHTPISPPKNYEQDKKSKGEEELDQALRETVARIEADEAAPLRLLIIDTYRASLRGDENSSEAASEYTNALRRVLSAYPQLGAIVSAHVGWEERSRERGSSGIRGAVEYALILQVKKGGTPGKGVLLHLSGLKARDTKVAEGVHMYRKTFDLGGLNQWGKPKTSCVIEPDDLSPEARALHEQTLQLAVVEENVLALLAAISGNELTNQGELFQSAGLSQRAGREAFRLARNRKLTDCGKKGSPYSLTDKGLAELGNS